MKNQQITHDDFPYDVLEKILSRLPVKSLLRLKAVCKSWKAVIEDPSFAGTHTKQSNMSNSRCFLAGYRGDDTYSLIKFDGQEFYRESVGRFQSEESKCAYFLCGCEGILVFENNYTENRERNFVLLNPCTRDYSTFSCPYDDETHANLMCKSEGYGLCWDRYEDDYKFIAVLHGGKYLVYSVKNDSWVERRSCVGGCVSREGTYVDGVVYWVNVSNGGIVYFDPEDGLLKKLNGPEDLGHDKFDLTNLGGCLCVYSRDKKSVIGIWLLKEDEHGGRRRRWKKIATVDNRKSPVEGERGRLFIARMPLYLTGENEVVFKNEYGTGYAVYHPDRREFGQVKGFPSDKMVIGFPCLESLQFPAIRRELQL